MFGIFCGPDPACLLCFFLWGGGGGGGVYSFVDQILSWAMPSRRSKLLSSGKGNSVECDCGVGFGDLVVEIFCWQDSVCSLCFDLKHSWILSWARPCLLVILGLDAFLYSVVGPDHVC